MLQVSTAEAVLWPERVWFGRCFAAPSSMADRQSPTWPDTGRDGRVTAQRHNLRNCPDPPIAMARAPLVRSFWPKKFGFKSGARGRTWLVPHCRPALPNARELRGIIVGTSQSSKAAVLACGCQASLHCSFSVRIVSRCPRRSSSPSRIFRRRFAGLYRL